MRGKKGQNGAGTITKGIEMDLRLRIKSESDIHSKFKQLQKDNEWTGQAAAMHIFRQYFAKPTDVIAMPSTGLAVTVAKNKAPAKKFTRPLVHEVAQYFFDLKSPNCNDEAEKFMDHFDSNGWKVGGKGPMKDWKASVRNFNRNNKGNTHGKDQSKAISGRDAITFNTTDF